ncbi:hypothetical protein [Streptomyces sp. NPDC002573]
MKGESGGADASIDPLITPSLTAPIRLLRFVAAAVSVALIND